MTDGIQLDALRRIVAKCEEPIKLLNGREEPTTEQLEQRAKAVADEVNHLFGAKRFEEYCGSQGPDLLVSPDLIAALIRVGFGEAVAIGRLLFNPTRFQQEAR